MSGSDTAHVCAQTGGCELEQGGVHPRQNMHDGPDGRAERTGTHHGSRCMGQESGGLAGPCTQIQPALQSSVAVCTTEVAAIEVWVSEEDSAQEMQIEGC